MPLLRGRSGQPHDRTSARERLRGTAGASAFRPPAERLRADRRWRGVASGGPADGETVDALERRLTGQDPRLEGPLRVTTTDTLAVSLLPPLLSEFHRRHPGILVELTTTSAFANLTRRDADVAIRPTNDPPEALVGRRIGGVAFAIYASRAYLDERGLDPANVASVLNERWIGLDDTLAGSSVARWMRTMVPGSQVALRCDSLVAACEVGNMGVGLVALPCYLGDLSPGLVRVGEPVPEMSTALWVLTHEDLRRTARVSAFTEFAAGALGSQRSLLEGHAPSATRAAIFSTGASVLADRGSINRA